MTDVKMASEGQRNYIAKLVRERVTTRLAWDGVDLVRFPIPHAEFRADVSFEVWAQQLTFGQAREVLSFLVELPEPPPEIVEAVTDAQRSKIWAQLKAAGHNTHRVWLLRKDDDAIPHLAFDDLDDGVWDWITSLSKSQASEVIQHLSGV